MIRTLIAIYFLCIGASIAIAKDPRVTAELENDRTIVGQPLLLRISILVPTWMPEPPIFPAVEIPSLLVRQPERSSGPISEKIDGETWSGVRRSYRLYPLAGGSYTLPPEDVVVTYANPDTNEPVTFSGSLPELTFTATIPEGASGLDPLIIASGFELQQQIDGDPSMAVGGALTRTITAKITGTSPIMIPRLSPAPEGDSLRAYPKDPQIDEKEDRGLLRGTRTETTSYVAQYEGAAVLPEVTLDWFNIETEQLETAILPTLDVSILGAASDNAQDGNAWQLHKVFWLMLGSVAFVAVAIRTFSARMVSLLATMRARAIQTEWYAAHMCLNAISRRDLTALTTSFAAWTKYYPGTSEQSFSVVLEGMASIGKARFGAKTQEATVHWRTLHSGFSTTRRRMRGKTNRARRSPQLHQLNPTWSGS